MMNPLDVNHVQKLVEGLYSSTNPVETAEIQGQLQVIQRQPQAWELASQLLSLSSDQCRFFGALTFQMKIARDWSTLPEDRIEWLRNELLGHIVRSSIWPRFITTKLCVALIIFSLHTVPTHWHNFISDSVNTILNGAAALGIPPQNAHITILEFMSLVPEEMANAEILGGKKSQLTQELKDGTPLVLSTLNSLLITPEPGIDTEMQQKALKCLQSWVQYGLDFDDAYPLIRQTMLYLGHEDLFEMSTEVLLEAMQQPLWAKYMTFRNDLLDCFTSDWMKTLFAECMTDENEDVGKSLAKLFTAYGETFTDFIAAQLAETKVSLLMNMILQLTAFHGHFPVDQEVSEIPLNFWYVLQETLFDNGIVPVKEGDAISIVAEGDKEPVTPEQQMWNRQCGETAVAIYRQLVTTLKHKAEYPEDQVWDSWTKDLKDKFRICRRDLGDTLINPYYVLRNEMIAIILDHAATVLNQWDFMSSPSQDLEATLFCLKSISEEIPADEDMYIPRLFGPDILGKLPQNCGLRLQNTTLLLIGSLSDWLKLHPEYLSTVMTYIVRCLSVPKLSPAAASAFSNICDTCRGSLTQALDSLMHVYNAMANSVIEPSIIRKVVESVADVIQVLPPDQAMSPLMTLTGDIIQTIAKALSTVKYDQEAARNAVLVQLQNLSACCRGIQSPSDDYQSLSARNSAYDIFARGEAEALYAHVDGFAQITQAVRQVTHEISGLYTTDEQIMKALAQFLESGIRSTSPLLTLPFDGITDLIASNYCHAPFACWLNTATFVTTVYGGHEANYPRLCKLMGTLTEKTLGFISRTEDMEQFPDVVDSYFGLLSGTIRRCPLVFYRLPHDMINTVFSFAIAAMGLQERLALKAALNFMADFIAQDYEEGSELAGIVNTMIMNMGLQITEQLIAGIGGRVPRSFCGPLVDVLFKMTGRYVEACRHWLQIVLSRESFPTALIKMSDKEMFMKGILGTRSFKKFKQITHEFSVHCRGLGNTKFGMV